MATTRNSYDVLSLLTEEDADAGDIQVKEKQVDKKAAETPKAKEEEKGSKGPSYIFGTLFRSTTMKRMDGSALRSYRNCTACFIESA